jgi:hypothetical protein
MTRKISPRACGRHSDANNAPKAHYNVWPAGSFEIHDSEDGRHTLKFSGYNFRVIIKT